MKLVENPPTDGEHRNEALQRELLELQPQLDAIAADLLIKPGEEEGLKAWTWGAKTELRYVATLAHDPFQATAFEPGTTITAAFTALGFNRSADRIERTNWAEKRKSLRAWLEQPDPENKAHFIGRLGTLYHAPVHEVFLEPEESEVLGRYFSLFAQLAGVDPQELVRPQQVSAS